MITTIETDHELNEEALAVLNAHLPLHKVALLLSIWQFGKGDYVLERDALFAGGTVNSLFEEASKLGKK